MPATNTYTSSARMHAAVHKKTLEMAAEDLGTSEGEKGRIDGRTDIMKERQKRGRQTDRHNEGKTVKGKRETERERKNEKWRTFFFFSLYNSLKSLSLVSVGEKLIILLCCCRCCCYMLLLLYLWQLWPTNEKSVCSLISSNG